MTSRQLDDLGRSLRHRALKSVGSDASFVQIAYVDGIDLQAIPVGGWVYARSDCGTRLLAMIS